MIPLSLRESREHNLQITLRILIFTNYTANFKK